MAENTAYYVESGSISENKINPSNSTATFTIIKINKQEAEALKKLDSQIAKIPQNQVFMFDLATGNAPGAKLQALLEERKQLLGKIHERKPETYSITTKFPEHKVFMFDLATAATVSLPYRPGQTLPKLPEGATPINEEQKPKQKARQGM